jgi:hypothetical protein
MRLALVLLSALLAGGAVAAPPPHASRGELARWLGELRTAGTAVGAPLAWQYSFRALDGRPLERLSLALVEGGYEIVSLGTADGFAELHVARLELHTPRTLEQRNGELLALARTYGARYVGLASPRSRPWPLDLSSAADE